MKPGEEFKVTYAPSFYESLQHVPEEEREELMRALNLKIEEIKRNPYVGTPVGAPWYVVAGNWVKRQYVNRKNNWRWERWLYGAVLSLASIPVGFVEPIAGWAMLIAVWGLFFWWWRRG